MSKPQSVWVCQSCGTQAARWEGKCNACGSWNSFVEEVVERAVRQASGAASQAVLLKEAGKLSIDRWESGFTLFDNVLGGGIVPGSVVLLGGEPGIGKSTLMRQVLFSLDKRILYASGEESIEQIKLQTDRLGITHDTVWLLSENSLDTILAEVRNHKPNILVIDSIQTLHSEDIDAGAGSISQVRGCGLRLAAYAKKHQVATFLVGHVNKAGMLAGPKVLEHMVDTVLHFEGERKSLYRVLRTQKNRFGSSLAMGLYAMGEQGLQEVLSPSKALLNNALPHESGNAVAVVIEGNKPLLIEVQALVGVATYGVVQRVATGMSTNRLHLLLALLEKKAALAFSKKDVFVNITGGVRIEDTAVDLAICMALVSSLWNRPVPQRIAFCAEIGLNGELRPVSALDARLKEAQGMEYKHIVCSAFGAVKKHPSIHPYSKISAVIEDWMPAEGTKDKGTSAPSSAP